MNEAEITTEELREMIRAGHSLLKDLKQAQRDTRALMVNFQALVQEAKDAPMVETKAAITEVTNEAVGKIAGEVSDIINDATALVEKTVYDRFDVLMSVLLGTHDRPEGQSIPEILRSRIQPTIDLEALMHVADPIERKKP